MTATQLAHDAVIYHEMLSHLPLFAHASPRQVAILHDQDRHIEQEVLKHPAIAQVFNGDRLPLVDEQTLDLLIIANENRPAHYKNHFQLLHPNGILVQQSTSPFDLSALKDIHHALKSAGFHDIHFIQFPQPSIPTGWRCAVLAVKHGVLRRPREKDIFNKTFRTHYYNIDMHKAALALPEFMRIELASD